VRRLTATVLAATLLRTQPVCVATVECECGWTWLNGKSIESTSEQGAVSSQKRFGAERSPSHDVRALQRRDWCACAGLPQRAPLMQSHQQSPAWRAQTTLGARGATMDAAHTLLATRHAHTPRLQWEQGRRQRFPTDSARAAQQIVHACAPHVQVDANE
jgi:hypothetical protein